MAKELRKAPRAIAQELVDELPEIDGVAAMEVAGAGYINLRLSRPAFALATVAGVRPGNFAGAGQRVLVEHTSINPNKAAHIGHLRNSILGDTFVRMLRATGRTVSVQNYIDNTGVQVADVVVGFHYLEKKSLEKIRALIAQPKFDYYCWDLYARISAYYADHEEARKWRADTLHAIEEGHGLLAEMGALVGDAIVELPFEHDVAAGHSLRRVAARERDSAPEVLGRGL